MTRSTKGRAIQLSPLTCRQDRLRRVIRKHVFVLIALGAFATAVGVLGSAKAQ